MNKSSSTRVTAKNIGIGAIPHRDYRDKPSSAQFTSYKKLAGIAAIAFVSSTSQNITS